MATARSCLVQLGRPSLSSSFHFARPIPARFLSTTASCQAGSPKKIHAKSGPKTVVSSNPQKNKKKGDDGSSKKKKTRTSYKDYDLTQPGVEMFSLLEAMRYIRAFEVGRTYSKYELAVRLRSPKNGPIVRNRLRLPHPVKTDVRICVICPPDSKYAEQAKAAGAALVGEEEIFEQIKDGKIEFDRCLCQLDSMEKMNKAQLGRILGPRGLMPSTKLGTVVKDPASLIKDFIGAAEYRERMGVVRMAIGQIGFTPEELAENISKALTSIKKDTSQLSERINKELAEVVLSSTNSPGFPLNGNITDPNTNITAKDLSIV